MKLIKVPSRKAQRKTFLVRISVGLLFLLVVAASVAGWWWFTQKSSTPQEKPERNPLVATAEEKSGAEAVLEARADIEPSELKTAAEKYQYHMDRATALVSLGRYDEAASAFDEAKKSGYELSDGYYISLGGAYEAQGDTQKAKQYYEKAYELASKGYERDADLKEHMLREIEVLIQRVES